MYNTVCIKTFVSNMCSSSSRCPSTRRCAWTRCASRRRRTGAGRARCVCSSTSPRHPTSMRVRLSPQCRTSCTHYFSSLVLASTSFVRLAHSHNVLARAFVKVLLSLCSLKPDDLTGKPVSLKLAKFTNIQNLVVCSLFSCKQINVYLNLQLQSC